MQTAPRQLALHCAYIAGRRPLTTSVLVGLAAAIPTGGWSLLGTLGYMGLTGFKIQCSVWDGTSEDRAIKRVNAPDAKPEDMTLHDAYMAGLSLASDHHKDHAPYRRKFEALGFCS
ncbi:MAG: hypothetical protein AB7G06_04040 [Bdellovibrionales bacterium]